MYSNYYQDPYMYQASQEGQFNMMPQQDIYTYPGNLQGALQLMREAVAGEREDEMFYDYLISVATSEEDKNIITGIRDDERKHNRMYRQMYKTLTGQDIQPTGGEEFVRPKSYCDGLKRAIQGELNAVIKYRKILFALQDRSMINMETEIITDELRHGNLYNMLFSKNGCFREEMSNMPNMNEMPNMPDMNDMPNMPDMNDMYNMPNMPDMQDMRNMNGMHNMHDMQDMNDNMY